MPLLNVDHQCLSYEMFHTTFSPSTIYKNSFARWGGQWKSLPFSQMAPSELDNGSPDKRLQRSSLYYALKSISLVLFTHRVNLFASWINVLMFIFGLCLAIHATFLARPRLSSKKRILVAVAILLDAGTTVGVCADAYLVSQRFYSPKQFAKNGSSPSLCPVR